MGDCGELTRLLRGAFIARPPSPSLVPSWDLDKVLGALRRHPFEPLRTVPVKFLTWKTVFLLAIVTAARSSDLSRLGCKEPYLRKQNSGFRLIPRLLKKQCRIGHCFKEMFVPKFEDRKLDPVRALNIYLDRVKDFRDLNSLFVTYGAGQKKSPRSQTIARWLVSAIKSAPGSFRVGPIRAHSTRSVSTTVAFARGVSVANILKAADWASASTFSQFYLKEWENWRTSFAGGVLGTGST